jgi:hypothetical protein
VVEAQVREIENLKAPGGRKQPNGRTDARPSSRRGLLKLGGAAGVASVAAIAGLGRTETAQATAGQPIVTGFNSVREATDLAAAGTFFPDIYVFAADATGAGDNNPVQAFRGFASGNASGVYAQGGRADGPGVTGVGGNGGSGGTGVVGTAGTPAQGGGGAVGVSGTGSGSGPGVLGSGFRGGFFQGAGAPISLLPAGALGPPNTNPHSPGDIWVDSAAVLWVCVVAGTPGTWVALQTGGSNVASNNSFYRAAITTQPTLLSSNGITWVDMDSANLKLTITPPFNCLAVLTGNCDLWTDTAGYNQDIGITVSGGAYPTTASQPEAWKESGGPGTFSPNAAFVQTAVPLLGGTAYTIKLQWKTNRNAPGAKIAAGAGPIGGKFSPTSLTASLIPSV